MTNPFSSSDPGPDRFHQLLTGALDGELSGAEQEEFERLLAASPERQNEWHEYRQLKEQTMQMRFNDPPAEVWDRYWLGVYNRLERRVAWTLVSIGAMVGLCYGGFKAIESILGDRHLPLLVKTAILMLMAGAVILLVSVLREKLFTRKTDKYKEIER